MIKLFLDIETIPCDEKDKDKFIEVLKSKKANGKKDAEQIWADMGLDGTFGRIFCIAYIKDNGVTQEKDIISGDEKEVLQKFWEVARDVALFIGHNVMDFDLPFIYQRSTILGVKPSQTLIFARYRNEPIFDTMREWTKWDMKKSVKLDTLARVFGYPTSKDSMDGSMVWQAYRDGKLDEICKYCMKDVELNRQVYYRMIYQELPENTSSATDSF